MLLEQIDAQTLDAMSVTLIFFFRKFIELGKAGEEGARGKAISQ